MSTFQELQEDRKKLPIAEFKGKIIETLKTNNVLVLIGETGSGKTTQLCQYLLEEGMAKTIAVTQPRRVAAISAARRVSQEMGVPCGDEVGYTVRFDDNTCSKTKVTYITDGCLMRECLADPMLTKYDVVILDEAHERSVHTDILMGMMKKTLDERRDMKVLVTSATLDHEKFSKYMNNCPVMHVSGRTFPVHTFHSVQSDRDYVKGACETVMTIHRDQGRGHILVFLTGQDEIEKACTALRKEQEIMKEQIPDLPDMLVLPLYGSLPPEVQTKVFASAPQRTRKVVVATNIAETSITIPGVLYVVDTGRVKEKSFDQRRGIEALSVVRISRTAAKQREGRAGRTAPGQCYRLYSRAEFEEDMSENTTPEIQRVNLSNVLLYLKMLGINDTIGFDFLDKPSEDMMIEALKQLHCLGALDADGNITTLGRSMASFPLEPSLSRTVIESAQLGCSDAVISIVAMLSSENVFYRPTNIERMKEADLKTARLSDESGDHITLMNIFEKFLDKRKSKSWCEENYFQYKALRQASDIREQIVDIVRKEKLSIGRSRDPRAILKAICAGFFMNAARKGRAGGFRMLCEDGRLVAPHPTSILAHEDDVDVVVYHEIVWTSKGFMRTLSKINIDWVSRLIPRLNNVDVRRLVGRRETSSGKRDREQVDDGAQKAEKKDAAKTSRTNKEADVAAARERYLKRLKARK